jgi:hypothetical protein
MAVAPKDQLAVDEWFTLPANSQCPHFILERLFRGLFSSRVETRIFI